MSAMLPELGHDIRPLKVNRRFRVLRSIDWKRI